LKKPDGWREINCNFVSLVILLQMKIRREIKIGAFLVIILLCFIFGINYIKGKDIFRKHRIFYAKYDQISGLVEAAPVSINGYNIGNVSKIHFEGPKSSKIIVEITVYNSLEIPVNSVARIFSPDILGTKNINIVLGNSPIMAQNGDTLQSSMQATLSEEVSQQVAPLKRKAEDLMLSLDTMVTVVRTIFNSQTRDNLNASFEHIRQTLVNLEHTTFNLDTLVYGQRSRMERILFNIESISANLRENDKNISNILTNFSAISDTLAKAQIAHTLDDVHSAVMNISMVVDKVNQGQGSIGMLVNDKKLYTNLENSSNELNRLITDLKLNPHRYLNFSVFPPSNKRMQYQAPDKK
jgi:phospholipid/cholesterol/gamma-HCH transport system substrate-binding protein